MPDYRLYFLDPDSGHINRAEDFHTADDVEAICLVQQRDEAEPMELWQGGRKIRYFDGAPHIAARSPG